MSKLITYPVGTQFNYCKTITPVIHGTGKMTFVFCKCRCGKVFHTVTSKLRNGDTKSCGCFSRNNLVALKTDHCHARSGAHTPTYRCWCAMRARCKNPKCKHYYRYGGRGIKVCARWNDFNLFLMDMGECPPGLSIHRIDNDKGYSLENCKWATDFEQNSHRSSTVLTIGKVKEIRIRLSKGDSPKFVASDFGVSRETIYDIRHGRKWKHCIA